MPYRPTRKNSLYYDNNCILGDWVFETLFVTCSSVFDQYEHLEYIQYSKLG